MHINFAQPVALNKSPSFTIREDRVRTTTESWRQWAEQREVDEWIANVAGVLEHGFNEQLRIVHMLKFTLMAFVLVLMLILSAANLRQSRPYEFPTGFNTLFGPDRFLPGELYFTQHHLQVCASSFTLRGLIAGCLARNCPSTDTSAAAQHLTHVL